MNHTTIQNDLLNNLMVKSIQIHEAQPNSLLKSDGSVYSLETYHFLDDDIDTNFLDKINIEFKKASNIPDIKGLYKLDIHFVYSFNQDISPDFDIVIKNKDLIIYQERNGLESYPNRKNKMQHTILISLDSPTDLNISLEKQDEETSNFTLYGLSFYSLLKI